MVLQAFGKEAKFEFSELQTDVSWRVERIVVPRIQVFCTIKTNKEINKSRRGTH